MKVRSKLLADLTKAFLAQADKPHFLLEIFNPTSLNNAISCANSSDVIFKNDIKSDRTLGWQSDKHSNNDDIFIPSYKNLVKSYHKSEKIHFQPHEKSV